MARSRPRPVGPLPTGKAQPGRDQILRSELQALLAIHDEMWRKLDFAGLAGLWDVQEGTPVYVGDEYPAPVMGWSDLGRHFGRLGGRLNAAGMSSTLLEAHSIAENVAVAVYLADWTLTTVESPDEHRGQRWVSAVLRRGADGWRFLHVAESPAYGIDAENLEATDS